MSQIYYNNLDIDLSNDIKNTKTKVDNHVDKVATSTELGHVKVDDLTIKINTDGQVYTTLTENDINTAIEYHQYVLPTTAEGQTSWTIPLATFDPTKDLIIVTHNTTILNDSMYSITSLGNVYSLNITEQIPTAIASNNVFIIILKGKAESSAVPSELSVDNTTIIKEDNMLKAVNIKGLEVPTSQINEYLTGTDSNIQQQINNLGLSLNNMVSGVEYIGRFETYAEILTIGNSINGDMAVVLTDETKEGARTLYIYSSDLAMWQFVGAFNIGGGSQFSDNFLELLDTPDNYIGASGKNVSVNVAGTGLEFTDTDYNNIINKPMSTTIAIDNAVTNSHTHANKSDLDRLGINMSDRLTIDGVDYVVDVIGSAVDSAKLYVDNQLATHDSKDATTTSKGHVQIGSGLSVTNGIVSVIPTTVPNATKTSKGQVQIGNGLSVASGVISVDATPNASTTTKGIMQVGEGLNVTDGIVNTNPVPNATINSKGILQVGTGLSVNEGLVSVNPSYVTGLIPQKEYLYLTKTGTQRIAQNNVISMTKSSGNITFDSTSNCFTLKQGKTYRVTFNTSYYGTNANSTTSTRVSFGVSPKLGTTWVGDFLGRSGPANSTTNHAPSTLDIIISPTVTSEYNIKAIYTTGTEIDVESTYTNLIITEL